MADAAGAWPYRDREPRTAMAAAEVRRLVDLLDGAGVTAWLDGGWGVDALLEQETREHDDLDLVVRLDDAPRLVEVLGAAGYAHAAGEPPHSFVLVDASGRQVDVHPVLFDADGGGVYVTDDGGEWLYPAEGFAGRGAVGRRPVRCLTPEVQVLVHDRLRAHGEGLPRAAPAPRPLRRPAACAVPRAGAAAAAGVAGRGYAVPAPGG